MNVILYSDQNSEKREKLQSVIRPLFPNEQIESHPTIESLEKRLRRFIQEPVVFVLQVSCMRELMQLLTLRDWLVNRKLILILPDEERNTIANGLVLQPRFVTCNNSDFSDVLSVLEKMQAFTFNPKNADYWAGWPEAPC